LDTGLSAYGVNGYVYAPDFVSTEYSKQIRGNLPSLLPAEVASKLYETLNSESSFMTVQHVGSSMDGSYGFFQDSRSSANSPLNAVVSKNDEEKPSDIKDANDEQLVKCIQLILPTLSYEQISDGGMSFTPGWDSLAQIQIMLEVEKQFEQRFSSVDFENLKTFNGILKALNKYKGVL
jgi:acyl carrier protein